MSDQPSLGGQVEAMFRQTAKDLHNMLIPAFPESARGVDEPGTPLAPTPQMVTEQLDQSYEAKLEAYSSRPQPEQSQEQER